VLVAGLLLAFVPAAQAATSLTVSPAGQDVGGTVTLGGSGFAATSVVTFTFDGSPLVTNPALVTTDANGNFSGVTFTVPSGTAVGTHTVSATDALTDTASSSMQVDSLSVGPAGQSDGGMVTLSGSGFAASSPVTFTFDGTTVATNPSSVTTDSNGNFTGVTFSVPAGATVGPHTVAATDGSTDTASGPLNVDSLSVSPGGQSVGGTVTVSGSGFAPSSPVTISFDGSTVATTTSDGSGNIPSGVTFTVPAGTSVGPHTVAATDGSGDIAGSALGVDSVSVSPAGQSAGGTVTLSGSGFAPSSSMTFTFDGATVTTNPSTVTTDGSGSFFNVTFSVPAGASVGSHTVVATDGSTDTASTPLNVDSLSVSPSGESAGGTVTVSGSGFAADSPMTFTFDGTTVTTDPASVTSDGSGNFSNVTFSVPDAASAGAHTVSTTDESNDIASTPLNVDSLSVSPSGQSPGGTATLSGSGFAPGSPVTVKFDDTTQSTIPASVTADSGGNFSNVTFSIPNGASVGPHTVSASDQSRDIASSPLNVETVVIQQASGVTGNGLTVSGAGWPQGDQIQVLIAGSTVCEPVANPQGEISGNQSSGCQVPSGLASGAQTVTAVDLANSSRQATAATDFSILGPTASFTTSPSSPVSTGTLVTFLPGPPINQITSWTWTFGDGQMSTYTTPTHAYTTPATYTVTLVVKDAEGDTSTVTHAVTVTPRSPTAAFSPTSATVLAGQSVAFDGTQSSDPNGGATLSYSWNFGDYGTATGAQPSHTYAMPGTYTVSLSVSDNYGQTSSVTHQITVIAPPPLQTIVLTPVAKPTIVKGGHVSATKSGIIDLGERLFCPGAGPHCTAYILASSTSLRHFADVARVQRKAIAATVAIQIKPNGSAEVKFKLNKRAFDDLRKKHRLPIRVKIALIRGQQTVTSVVSLVFVLR
jgi:PKD repeat protein